MGGLFSVSASSVKTTTKTANSGMNVSGQNILSPTSTGGSLVDGYLNSYASDYVSGQKAEGNALQNSLLIGERGYSSLSGGDRSVISVGGTINQIMEGASGGIEEKLSGALDAVSSFADTIKADAPKYLIVGACIVGVIFILRKYKK